MVRLLDGIALGFAAGYLYGSERARDEARRRFASAPEPVRQATERLSGAIAGSPVPDALKQAATRATAAVQTATEKAAQSSAEVAEVSQSDAAEAAARLAETLQKHEPKTPTA